MRLQLQIVLLIFFSLSYSGFVPVHSTCNNDGVIDLGEECDDRNLLDNDGCTNCLVDPIVLDFDIFGGNTERYSKEFFNLDEVVFFADPASSRLTVTPNLDLTRIFLVMVGDDPPVQDDIDIFTTEAFDSSRTDRDFGPYFDRSILRAQPTDPRFSNLNTFLNISLVTQGMLITGSEDSALFGGDGDDLLSFMEAEIVVMTAGYRAGRHPGYNPREFCIILTDGANATTTSCLTLFFIGFNDDAPVINYTREGVVSFTEGQMEYVPIINGTIEITDQDHPERYRQMSAQARIVGFTAGYPEFLDVTMERPEFTYSYDSTVGTLTISGEATPELYATLLSDLTYFNNMTEPIGSRREIELTVYDGAQTSNAVIVEVTIVNTNDAPAISLDGEAPVITTLSLNYTEGSGNVAVVPNLVVLDSDPNPMIQRVVVRLLNPVDGDDEQLGLISLSGLNVATTLTPHEVTFSGVFTTEDYSAAVSRLTYTHTDAAPGNPTSSEIRLIEFNVEDDNGVSSIQNSTLQITILPVNDAPILLYITDASVRDNPRPVTTGSMSTTFEYTEDDLPLNFGQDIYLRDVDSNITSASLQLENLLNGVQDIVYVTSDLYNVVLISEESEDETTRVLTLIGEATPQVYEQILRSLTYNNNHSTNQVEDGTRTITISVNDTYQLQSLEITAHIDVGDRNDAPGVDLGAGEGMDLVVEFTENGASVPIVLPHIVRIMDEEGHNISRLTAELVSPNGKLDPSDAIFLRSPLAVQFIDDFRVRPTTTLLDIAMNDTTMPYTDLLLSIFFNNDEAEPTLFNSTGSQLIREVIITVYDDNFLQDGEMNSEISNFDDNFGVSRTIIRSRIVIVPINDNPPRIVIRAEPGGCGVSSTEAEVDSEGVARRRRDVRAAASRVKKRTLRVDDSKAPKVISAHVTFDSNCLDTVIISFDAETTTPIVEVSSKLDAILSFDSPQLNSAHKFGVWLNYTKLAVVFDECADFGESEMERPVHVIFEADRGACDWTSACKNDTVCFHNNTGCPVSGAYRLTMADTECVYCQSEGGESDQEDMFIHSYNTMVLALVVIVVVTVFLGALFMCSLTWMKKSQRKRQSNLESTTIEMPCPTSKKLLPVQELGAQDLVVTVSSPPPSTYETVKSLEAKKPEAISKEGKKPEAKLKEAKKPKVYSKDVERRRRKSKRKSERVDDSEDEEILLLRDESLSIDSVDGGVVTLSAAERSCDPPCEHQQGWETQDLIAEGVGDNSHTSREHLLNSGNAPSSREGEGPGMTTPTPSLPSQEAAPLISH